MRPPSLRARPQLLEQQVSRGVQFLAKIRRPADVRVYVFHQAAVRRANFLFGRPCVYSQDFASLSDAQLAGRRVAPTILFLLPLVKSALSGFSFPLQFFLLPFLELSRSGFTLSLPFFFQPQAMTVLLDVLPLLFLLLVFL
jgi:hypothetical protein